MGRKLRNGHVKPYGVSIDCLNQRTGRYKIRHELKLDAELHALELSVLFKERYEAYFCHQCRTWHAGRPRRLTLSDDNPKYERDARTLYEELGPRAFTHLAQRDRLKAIESRFNVIRKRKNMWV